MNGIERYTEGLAPELRRRVMDLDTVEDVFALAREEGLELPDEALDAVYGGCSSYTYKVDDYYKCNVCDNKVLLKTVGHDGFPSVYYCNTCLLTRDPDEVHHYYNKYKSKKN